MARAVASLLVRAEGTVVTLALLLLTVRAIFVLLDVDPSGTVSSYYTFRDKAASSLLQGYPATEAAPAHGIGFTLPLKPAGVPLHPFVLFSAYRQNEKTIHVIGLLSRLVRDQGRPVLRCEWHSGFNASRRLITKPQLNEGETDWGKLPYSEVVITCKFPRPVGMDGLGGLLHVTVRAIPQVGEVKTLRVPGKLVEVASVEALRESPGYNFSAATAAPYRYKYAYCSAPISGDIRPEVLRPWLVYHLHMYQGHNAHFFLYNVGGLNQQALAILKPFVEAGLVTIWDILEQPLFPAWWTSQILFMDDCVHRSRYLADWVLFHDFDEFLYVAPPSTLHGLLETHKDAPMVTFGNWEIDIESCRPQGNDTEWPLHRMLWRSPLPECRDPKQKDPFLCTGSLGRRKYALNPRKEISVVVHYTLGEAYQNAVHVNASLARIEHYRGIFSFDKKPCSYARTPGIPVPPQPKRYSWSTREMGCDLCPLIPQAETSVAAIFSSTVQGKAFVDDLLLHSREL